MAGYNTTATVVLSVNGKQARQMMSTLEKDAKRLETGIAAAARAGDKATMKKLQRELNSTNRMMEQLRNQAAGVDTVLRRLDQATPKELRRTLKQLEQQLNGIQRGSAAWDAHTAKIRAVREELGRVNAAMRTQQSLGERLNGWVERFQMAVMAAAAAVTGLIMAGRKSVDAYAEMEQEEANVWKYTGMAAREVGALNEEFKKMDTRSSREQLNQYAQEAGRLGKQTQEDVLGYVKAADKVNVALDDLGKGATLTLSKLTGIFGDEKRLGTEKALLSVGSVINELSQNCSASAPYLAEFASRVGGVGKQANMTVQQIMGFAAVLDSNNQKVEASSTALSQVIVRIYQEPAKYAKVAGLDVKRFSKLVNEDMNAALLEFLTALKSAGRMDTLSPMFKDMGETGARAIAALSTLAGHVEEVKAQQAEANKAFAEATSIGNEFDVQNNTVMAGLEKARKRVNEYAVELGEKLCPVMKLFYSSSTVALKVLSVMVDYFLKNRTGITMAAAAVAAYSAAVLAVSVRVKAYNALLLVGAKAQSAWSVVTRLGAVAAAAFRNSVDYLRNGLEVTYTMQERWSKAMAAMNWKLWAAGVLGVAAAVAYLCKVMTDTFSVSKLLSDVNKEANKTVAEQKGKIDDLRRAMNDQNLSYAERIKAIKELERIIPGYHAWLTREGEIINENTKAIDDYVESLRKAARAEAAKAKLVELEKERLDIETDMEADKDFNYERGAWAILGGTGNPVMAAAQYTAQSGVARGVNEAKLLGIRRKTEALEGLIAGEREKELEDDKARREKENAMMLKINRELYAGNEEYRKEVDKWKEKLKRDRETMSEAKANKAYNDGIFGLNQRYFGTTVEPEPEADSGKGYVSTVQAAKEAKKSELEAKRELAKAKASFKAAMEKAKGDWETGAAYNEVEYAQGLKTYQDFLDEKERLDREYIDARIRIYEGLYEDETPQARKLLLNYDETYRKLLLERAQAERAAMEKQSARSVKSLEKEYKMRQRDLKRRVTDSRALEQGLSQLKVSYLRKYRDTYKEYSKEWVKYNEQLEEELHEDMAKRQKELAEYLERYRAGNGSDDWEGQAQRRLTYELGLINELNDQRKLSDEEYFEAFDKTYNKFLDGIEAERGKRASKNALKNLEVETGINQDGTVETKGIDLRSSSSKAYGKLHGAYEEANVQIKKLRQDFEAGSLSLEQFQEGLSPARKNLREALNEFLEPLIGKDFSSIVNMGVAVCDVFRNMAETGELSWDDISEAAESSVAAMTAGLQTYSQFAAAQSKIDIANAEKKYDAMLKAAEGNSYMTRKLEKEKEAELERLKAKAVNEEFKLKVVEAVAQTASNAIAAYGVGFKFPFPANTVMPAVLAGLATASGLVQVALIKKQQQATAASGYSEGGFTPAGPKDREVGVVHAGEWVALQKLVNNPRVRPLLEALDRAQRANTIGSITQADVSRSVAAPMVLAAQRQEPVVVNVPAPAPAPERGDSRAAEVLGRLARRLDEPFVTVNTVTGDKGMKKAQDDYDRLMRNKRPKLRK